MFAKEILVGLHKNLAVVVVMKQSRKTVIIVHAPREALHRNRNLITLQEEMNALEGVIEIPAL